jgi:hypothetical protein
LDPLPDEVDAAGAGDDVLLSFDGDDEGVLSFDPDDEPLDEDDSAAVAALRLSVR